MAYWSHPKLTGGQPIEILPLNIMGESALIDQRIAIEARGTTSPGQATKDDIEAFLIVAYYTIDRFVPGLKMEDLKRHLDGASKDFSELRDAILAANGKAKPDPKALPQASVA